MVNSPLGVMPRLELTTWKMSAPSRMAWARAPIHLLVKLLHVSQLMKYAMQSKVPIWYL